MNPDSTLDPTENCPRNGVHLYTLKVDGGAVADLGKLIVIWKHEGGSWKVHRDIFNTNQPAA